MNRRKFSQQPEIIYYQKGQPQNPPGPVHKRSLQISHKPNGRHSDSRTHMKVIEYIQKTDQDGNEKPSVVNQNSTQNHIHSHKRESVEKNRKQSVTFNLSSNENGNVNPSKRVSRVSNAKKVITIFKKKQTKRGKGDLLRKYFIDVNNQYLGEMEGLKKQYDWVFSTFNQYPNNYKEFNHDKLQSVIPLRQRTRSVNLSVEKKRSSLNYEDLFKTTQGQKGGNNQNQDHQGLNISDMKQQTVVKRQRAQSIQISRVRKLSDANTG